MIRIPPTRGNRPAAVRKPTSKSLTLTGGVNQLDSLDRMGPGELVSGINIIERGGEPGYEVVYGFEEYSGEEFVVPDPNEPTVNITVTLPSQVPVIMNDDQSALVDDTAREFVRTSVNPPLAGGIPIGYFNTKGEHFSVVLDIPNTNTNIYRKTVTGWNLELVLASPDIATGFSFVVDAGSMSKIPVADPNTEVVFLSTGYRPCVQLSWDVATTTLSGVDIVSGGVGSPSENLPSTYPLTCVVFDNKLVMSFPDGGLFLSDNGDPLEHRGTTFAQEFNLKYDCIDLLPMPQSCAIFMTKGIDVLKKITPDLTNQIDLKKDPYSSSSSAFPNTAKAFMGVGMFCDKHGMSILETVSDYGDFTESMLTDKVQTTYLNNLGNVVGTLLDEKQHQYWILFNTGEAIVVTVAKDTRTGSLHAKGSGIINLGTFVRNAWSPDGGDEKYLCLEDDSTYFMHRGCQSFNGSEITFSGLIAYHSYGTLDRNKHFHRVRMGFSAPPGFTFNTRASMNYGNSDSLKSATYTTHPAKGGSTYGGPGVTYGGPGVTYGASARMLMETCDIGGEGLNMGIEFFGSSKIHTGFVLRTATVLYTNLGLIY